MINKIKVFLLGMREFNSSVTTSFDGELLSIYEWGREWAHRITLRHYDN